MDHRPSHLHLRQKILGVLQSQGPKCQPQLSALLNEGYLDVGPCIAKMSETKEIRFVGWACDFGITGVRYDCPVWALPGVHAHPALIEGKRVACVACGGSQVYRMKNRSLECRTCNTRFFARELGRVEPDEPPKPKRPGGSGIIAGRIEIGRGSKWGAGLV